LDNSLDYGQTKGSAPTETNPNWRLIPLLDAAGTTQMAIDRWLLSQHQLGKQPSVLRFYTWSKPTISLGYHQKRYPQAWQELVAAGVVDLVRRPTGGRAVLHQGDLTYAVVTSQFAGKRMEVYEQICQFLIQGWQALGVTLHYGNIQRNYLRNPNCFGTATGADLVTVTGEKLIGSAQVKKKDTILQHGSMGLSPQDLYPQVFGEAKPTLDLAVVQSQQEFIPPLIEALTQAAKDCFGIRFQVQPLSEAEWEEIGKVRVLPITQI
jgi:lipoate-protein ligase A